MKYTPSLWLSHTYTHQKEHSKSRNHSAPMYTKGELWKWITTKHHNLFEELFTAYVESDRDRWLYPSIDRINDDLPYSLDNIQLMTWRENDSKYRYARETNKRNKPVVRIDLSTGERTEYLSGAIAATELGITKGSIHRAARGERKSLQGCRWEFVGEPWVYCR